MKRIEGMALRGSPWKLSGSSRRYCDDAVMRDLTQPMRTKHEGSDRRCLF